MSVRAEAIAAEALREWLLLQLPARVAAANLVRAAVLKAAWAGPYTIADGAQLKIQRVWNSAVSIMVALTAGSRTAAQVASDINAVLPGLATVDSAERLVLTSPTAPVAGTPSYLEVKGDVSPFGWVTSAKSVVSALVAPGWNDVCDGLPQALDFASRGPGTVVVFIGDRRSQPLDDNPRRNEHRVSLDVHVLRVEPDQHPHRTREAIQAAVACVREATLTPAGRQLGVPTTIVHCVPRNAAVAGQPFKEKNSPVLFDGAGFTLEVKVFERPS